MGALPGVRPALRTLSRMMGFVQWWPGKGMILLMSPEPLDYQRDGLRRAKKPAPFGILWIVYSVGFLCVTPCLLAAVPSEVLSVLYFGAEAVSRLLQRVDWPDGETSRLLLSGG